MNKKVMWLMVGLVVAVLPTVAIADVMLTAYANGNETQVPDAFYIQQGSNYANAHALAGFTWTPSVYNESEILGTMTLGYMTNETIYEVNVLDINFTGLNGPANFTISVTVPNNEVAGGVFPTGSHMYITDAPQMLDPLPSAISLSHSGTHTLSFTVTSDSTIYIGFAVGSGVGGGTFYVDMSLIESS